MPRHRHNFEQIRLPLCGSMNLGGGLVLEEGQIGYFPEGLPYGPQQDPLGHAKPGERLQLVLQFGGASGYGFMSMDQRKAAWAELQKPEKSSGRITIGRMAPCSGASTPCGNGVRREASLPEAALQGSRHRRSAAIPLAAARRRRRGGA